MLFSVLVVRGGIRQARGERAVDTLRGHRRGRACGAADGAVRRKAEARTAPPPRRKTQKILR